MPILSRMLRRSVLLATAVALVAPTVAHGALLWTMTANPLTVSTGSTTDFKLTALNADLLLTRIRCIVVDVPDNFDVMATAAPGGWSSSHSGNRVSVQSATGIGLLQSVTFTVRAFASRADDLTWPANAYSRADCGGSRSLLGVPPIVLVIGPDVTPTPSPTAVPTPTPKPTPSPTPTPRSVPTPTPRPTPEPMPRPTVPPPQTPTPTFASGTAPSQGATVVPSAAPAEHHEPRSTSEPFQSDAPAAESPPDGADPTSATPSPSASAADGDGAQPAQPLGGGIALGDRSGASAGHASMEARTETDGVRVALGPLGLLGGIDIWAIPGLIIGLPGLLLIAFVLLQAVGALAWLPAIRRLNGDEPEANLRAQCPAPQSY